VRSDDLQLQIIEEQDSVEYSQQKPDKIPKQVFHHHNVTHNRLNEEVCTEEEEDREKGGTKPSEPDVTNREKMNSESDEDVILFVEYKFCTICHIEQPLRTRHCRLCDHCVATYDHHCPWIGNCVGERNHFYFYWFLIFQIIQLLLGLTYGGESLVQDERELEKYQKGFLGIVLLTALGFFFFVASLFCFHSYLITRNLTSWEFYSWMKISYTKVWPRKYGSPFSRGNSAKNCCQFFRLSLRKQRDIHQWTMPTKLPKLRP